MFFFMLGLVNYCPDEMELEIPSGEVFANKIREIQRKLEIAYQMLTPILGHSEYSLIMPAPSRLSKINVKKPKHKIYFDCIKVYDGR